MLSPQLAPHELVAVHRLHQGEVAEAMFEHCPHRHGAVLAVRALEDEVEVPDAPLARYRCPREVVAEAMALRAKAHGPLLPQPLDGDVATAQVPPFLFPLEQMVLHGQEVNVERERPWAQPRGGRQIDWRLAMLQPHRVNRDGGAAEELAERGHDVVRLPM